MGEYRGEGLRMVAEVEVEEVGGRCRKGLGGSVPGHMGVGGRLGEAGEWTR